MGTWSRSLATTSTLIAIVVSVVLASLAVISNWYLLSAGVNVYDEGIILTGAARVLHGDIPNRDFWSMYPPGPFYVLAALFGMFGETVTTERCYDLVIRSMLPLVMFWCARGIGTSYWSALFSWVFALLWLGHFSFSGYPIYAALLFFIASIIAFQRFVDQGRQTALLTCGILAVIGTTFRHDFGGFYLIALALVFLLQQWREKLFSWRTVMVFTGGILALGLPLGLMLLLIVGPSRLFQDLLTTPATVMPAYRWLPYPALIPFRLESVVFYAYPAMLVLGVLVALGRVVWNKQRDAATYALLLASLFGIALINQARVRSDLVHLLPCMILGCLVGPSLALMVWRLPERIWAKLTLRVSSLSLLTVLIALAHLPFRQRLANLPVSYFTLTDHGGRVGSAAIAGNLRQIVDVIHELTQADDRIYVGVTNHDQFTINHVALYFLSDRQPATRYHELHPGVTTRADIQQEIITELSEHKVKLVVLTASYGREPNRTSVDEGIDLLDTFIREHYRRVHQMGGYQIWLRKF